MWWVYRPGASLCVGDEVLEVRHLVRATVHMLMARHYHRTMLAARRVHGPTDLLVGLV